MRWPVMPDVPYFLLFVGGGKGKGEGQGRDRRMS